LVRTVLADSGVLTGHALHLPSRIPSQTVHSIGICTWSPYSHVLKAGYASDVTGSQEERTNGGKVKANAAANVEAGHEGDGAASADEIISHYI
jgi:hypothetical protein